MSDSKIIIGKKISELTRLSSLYEKDILVFSKYKETQSSGVDIYQSSNGIMFNDISSQLYNEFSNKLLNDDRFLNGIYGILSSRFLNDQNFINELSVKLHLDDPVFHEGTIIYKSCYPE